MANLYINLWNWKHRQLAVICRLSSNYMIIWSINIDNIYARRILIFACNIHHVISHTTTSPIEISCTLLPLELKINKAQGPSFILQYAANYFPSGDQAGQTHGRVADSFARIVSLLVVISNRRTRGMTCADYFVIRSVLLKKTELFSYVWKKKYWSGFPNRYGFIRDRGFVKKSQIMELAVRNYFLP